jgi:hypothetical protein
MLMAKMPASFQKCQGHCKNVVMLTKMPASLQKMPTSLQKWHSHCKNARVVAMIAKCQHHRIMPLIAKCQSQPQWFCATKMTTLLTFET